MIPIKETAGRVVFLVQGLPRSSQCKLVGGQGDFFKIKINPGDNPRGKEKIMKINDFKFKIY
jgi:hypothetical protein